METNSRSVRILSWYPEIVITPNIRLTLASITAVTDNSSSTLCVIVNNSFSLSKDILVSLEDSGVCIIADEFSAVYLDGLTIDFSDDLIESGFRLTNAKAGGSCGCGASFSTEVSFSV